MPVATLPYQAFYHKKLRFNSLEN